jgi:16S rRNA (cytosine967-C5)-methyltransferase
VVAAHVVQEVVDQGRSLSDILPRSFIKLAREKDSALLQEIAYGVVRWYLKLDRVLVNLLQKPFKKKDRDLHFLLLCGLYQLQYMKTPSHAAVKETVEATRALGKAWASGLANAVLRRFMREQDRCLAQAESSLEGKMAHPQWLIDDLQQDWPEYWHAILTANNERAPMTLRVNARSTDRQSYLEQLRSQGIEAHEAEATEYGITLVHPVSVDRLPGFAEGLVSVQDAAAQQAAPLLQAGKGMRVLDACAAPGGKSAHILECYPGLAELVALDVDATRLERVEETLQRLGLQAVVVQGDAADPDSWWDGNGFDRILLDAPCSATGVIRRHPDIKLLRRAEDISQLAAKQAEILDVLWPMLESGGLLVYATCSVLKKENSDQIQAFLSRWEDAMEIRIDAGWGHEASPGRQVLPGEDGMDGFYYACLRKIK